MNGYGESSYFMTSHPSWDQTDCASLILWLEQTCWVWRKLILHDLIYLEITRLCVVDSIDSNKHGGYGDSSDFMTSDILMIPGLCVVGLSLTRTNMLGMQKVHTFMTLIYPEISRLCVVDPSDSNFHLWAPSRFILHDLYSMKTHQIVRNMILWLEQTWWVWRKFILQAPHISWDHRIVRCWFFAPRCKHDWLWRKFILQAPHASWDHQLVIQRSTSCIS